MKKLYTFFLSILLFNCINVYADYLPINYFNERYNNTTVWYSIIPSKYKMHYAYGGDVIGRDEEPSLIAKRHDATIAINTQHMGSVKIEGTNNLLERGSDVSKYDFYVINGIKDSYSNYKSGFGKNEAHMIATSTTSSKVGIDLSNVVDPIWCTDVMCFVPLVSNGKIVNNWYKNWDKINNGSYVFKGRYIDGTTVTNNYDYKNIIVEKQPRSWIAIDNDGNQFVATCGGRSDSESGFDIKDIYDFTINNFNFDIKFLYMLDGGYSTSFIYKGKKINNSNKNERKVNGIFYWKVDNYTISYNLNGGKVVKNNPTVYNIDTKSFILNNPSKSGYEFIGWEEEVDGVKSNGVEKNIKVSINKNNVGNRVYTAVYKKIDNNTIVSNNNKVEEVIVPDTLYNTSYLVIFFGVIFISVGLLFVYKYNRK